MEQLRKFALTVVIGALICSVLLSLVHSSSQEKLLRVLCGIFLGLLVLKPLAGRDWELSLSLSEDITAEASLRVQEGKDMASEAEARYISQALEAYILDKASRLGITLTAEVTLGEDLLPEAVVVHGTAGEEAKEELSQILEQDLGIPKENQRWTG